MLKHFMISDVFILFIWITCVQNLFLEESRVRKHDQFIINIIENVLYNSKNIKSTKLKLKFKTLNNTITII